MSSSESDRQGDEDLSIDGMLKGRKMQGATPPAIAAE